MTSHRNTTSAQYNPDVISAVRQVIEESKTRDRNEANTRHQIIDFVLHDYLNWPRNRVSHEDYINEGYTDYILKKSNGDPLLVIEAKKEGVSFELPIPHNQNETYGYVSLNKLVTDTNISSAIRQVKNYCYELGSEFACITNGHEWIFFKTFEKGKKWETLQAFVIRSLYFFETSYTKAQNSLSFVATTENAALSELLTSAPPKDRAIYYPKEKIPAYSHPITQNRLAAVLRPIVNRYFGVIRDDDPDFMDKCYVSQRDYQSTFDGMRTIIQDALTPYFENHGVRQLEDSGKGGHLGGRLSKNIKLRRKSEVLVLFGGKGSGKSTFIKRILHHNPPPWLRDHAVVCIIDLLKTPEDKEVIRSKIWSDLVDRLDIDQLLDQERDQLINSLFQDQFKIAAKQDLAGLPKTSEIYNVKLNDLLLKWKQDKAYCSKRLAGRWEEVGKGVIVVIDNTDQFSSSIQDFCFSSAQEISKLLDCAVLISMREERFFNSKIHGVLDAFQKSGFHISSPRPSDVFRKRLDYVAKQLNNVGHRDHLVSEMSDKDIDDCTKYLNILSADFARDSSPLNNFLTACAHGDIRLSLDLFSSFLLSGYTNVDEMISAGTWTFKIHQVIKPVMVPTRYFYDERLSDIPNIFQLRSTRHGSHFTGLRILRKIGKGIDISSPSYFSVGELKAYFSDTFNMIDDFEKNLDILLKHGFVEANNRLDEFTDAVDSIKITNYGMYMSQQLAYFFPYLDLVCTDCGIFDQQTSNYLTEAAKGEYQLFVRRNRLDRVKVRLDRVEKFIDYLSREENAERETYSLGMPKEEMFTHKAKTFFDAEKNGVLASASKPSNKN
ncbi:hypothetical protein LH442_08330 [Laribacter hongkongensis]|uniref:type I restriction endonuclease n=1 Tax=Laribacter hongkongensis TaxID=168471 RepID=UPI001EFE10C1|nr:type I restriction endonuclease [Laribacter hongkongensis]MCG9056000.1 hypothetical protein [Laribacter hongkongensis]